MQESNVSIPEFHKELDLIQGCISRVAHNSFIVRGWAFTLVVAFISLTSDNIDLSILCIIGIFILVLFWCLDSFFLRTEQLYRFKYEWVIEERPKGNSDHLYDLNPYESETWKEDKKKPLVISVMFSRPYTLLLFYGSPILIGIAIIVLR